MTTAETALPVDAARAVVEVALDEDLGPGEALDVTTWATIPSTQRATAQVVARASGVVAGVGIVEIVLAAVNRRLGGDPVGVQLGVDDGDGVGRGDVLAVLEGPARAILVAERTILNLLCRLSGIATHTRLWADELAGTGARVLDTRKTTPGLRELEKYAVRAGGGGNKRMGLYDVAMIKDNHKLAAGSITAAFESVRRAYPDVAVEVEATTTQEALEAVRAGARFILLDNMSTDELSETVRAVRGTNEDVELEATGGLTLATARAVAMTGVDYLSVGALTHSSPILDIAVDLTSPDAAT